MANPTVRSDDSVTLRVLVYSSDASTRERVIRALGPRPHPDLPEFAYLEVATAPVVVRELDAGGIDLAVLDGEAQPAGGMGVAKQLRDELDACPPIVVLTGRADDRWLADWSRADGVVQHPIEPFALAETVVSLLRPE